MARTDKPKRRKPNTGTIRYKPARAQYEAAFPLGNGRYRYDYFATAVDAAAHLDRLTAERDHVEAPRNIAGGSQTIEQFLLEWLNTKRNIKPKTMDGYRHLCSRASLICGSTRLDAFTSRNAQALIDTEAANGFKNVRHMVVILKQAFKYAVDEAYIKKNPFTRVYIPTVDHKHARALSAAQRALLLDVARDEDARWQDIPLAPLWHLYSRLGLRRGEGMGVRWSDLDLQHGVLSITQQYTSVGNATVKSTPKTKRSRRRIPLPKDVVDMLLLHKQRQRHRAANNPNWQEHGLVFTNPDGDHLDTGHIRHRWVALRKRAGLPDDATIHGLRHTASYLMELDGVPGSVIQAILGHSSITMTQHYSDHASEDMDAMRRAIGA